MKSHHALVVTFDRFPASILGCYGNEWIETPHLDRLAAGGWAADQCWSTRVGPASAEDVFSAKYCLESLKASRVRSRLFLEEGSHVDFSDAGFGSLQIVTGERGPEAKPDRIPFAEMVRAAQAAWNEERDSEQPCLIWLHACGLEMPAAPPQGFAEIYQDEFEDRGVKFEALSDVEREQHPSIAAGMASLFDHWLGQLAAAIAGDQRPMLTIVCAAQGSPWQPFPNSFGELDTLRSQSAHVPLIVHLTGDDGHSFPAGLRNSQLLSTADLGPLVTRWFCRSDHGETSWTDWLSQQSAAHSGRIVTECATGARRISTLEWGAIIPAVETPSESSIETKPLLFRKPEDYWEVNNLAEISAAVVEDFLSEGRQPPDCA